MAEPIPFQRVSIAPVAAFGESFRRIKDQYGLFLGITVVGMLLAGVAPMGLLLGPMYCGMYTCYRDKWRGRPVKFDTLFKGFESFIFLQSFIATLIMMGIGLLTVVPLVLIAFFSVILVASQRAPDAPSSGHMAILMVVVGVIGLLAILVMMLVGALFSFTFPLIVDRRLTGVMAVTTSARAAWANIAGLLGLTLTGFALGMLGLCACYVGAFLVAPITFGAHLVAYERVFGIADAPAVTAGSR